MLGDSGAKNGISADGEDRRKEGRAVVRALDGVGNFAGPAGIGSARELSGLPLILLIGVRIEILGKIFVGSIGLPRGWLNEGRRRPRVR